MELLKDVIELMFYISATLYLSRELVREFKQRKRGGKNGRS